MRSRSERPRLGVDADGLLFDFHGHALRIINRIRGTKFTEADNTEWDFDNILGDDPAVRKEFRYRLEVERTASLLTVLPEAGELLDAMERLGDVWVVTSPYYECQTWCFDRMMALRALGVSKRRVQFASEKTAFDGIILLDDKASNLADWEDGAQGVAERRGILWERPWSGPWAGWRATGENRVGQVVEMVEFELARRGLR